MTLTPTWIDKGRIADQQRIKQGEREGGENPREPFGDPQQQATAATTTGEKRRVGWCSGQPERDASLAANYRDAGTIMEIRLKPSICDALWDCLAF